MSVAASTLDYLKHHQLKITTAESCTAGKIITLLSQVDGGGACIESGYVVYSPQAKQRLLNVRAYTIETFNLTSCEVAREMVHGALHDSPANVAVATTGLLGPDALDGIPPGTVCFAWAFRIGQVVSVFSRKEHFSGSREQVQLAASVHALQWLPHFHQRAVAGERG
ncbi:CinA family protein [Pseudomonas poae]|uniref:Amidohydrolase, PncC family n=1 Tax=Pseudomonas poae TaxID=200451 RepID=A0AAP2S425_9PSED|nr:CinA family protein [Pseudomonas poae]ELQ15426.1 competence/damage-inducible protein CinA C-terminal domain-containing protein [Pseudomonas fluorescens BRIP34879]KTC40472.1 ompetence-damaged protein [Pseudomonas sp. ABAC21]KRP51232.1 ompetence-damaged protein [Pseudomonas poae]MBC3199491.1 CinA family protein [Pseudomonas poae]MCF5657249.1 nicotinamide-nucleotide amidohydrolase family protein [Pseudomonas poae]